jgi:hypothetical protein
MRHIVTRYHGVQVGWLPLREASRPRLKADAERLAAFMRRIDPLHCYRATALEPELPKFV